MRNLKKALVLVLALAMMLSLMVMGAGAAFTDQSEIDSKHTEAVDMCVALNIINGYTDGSFKPNGNVTREEMAKMICILDNGGKEPQLAPGNAFSDVAIDRWSNKYIEACASRGIVAGVGDGKFNPSGNVTATQAARMLLVELGYDQSTEEYTGPNWAVNVNLDATQKGYYEDLEDVDVTAPLTREHAAQMVWNALQAVEVEYNNVLVTDGNGNLSATSKSQDKTHQVAGTTVFTTLLWDKYDTADAYTGVLVDFTYDATKTKWTYTLSTGRSAKSTTDYTDLLGMNVKLVYQANDPNKDAYGMFADDSKVLFSGKIADLPNLENNATSIKFGGTTYKLDGANIGAVPVEFFTYNAGDIRFFYNVFLDEVAGKYTAAQALAGGVPTISAVGDNITWYDPYDFAAIDNDDNGKIDLVMVYPYAAAKVSYCVGGDIKVTPTTGGADAQGLVNAYMGLIPAGATNKLEIGDDVTAYDGIAKNDYVKYIPADYTKDNVAVVTKADLFSGKVTVEDDPDFTVDGTNYTADVSYGAAPGAGSMLTDAVVINGFVFDIDSTQRKEVKDFAVVVAVSSSGIDGDRAKLLFNDGSKQVVPTDTDYTGTFVAGDLVTYRVNSDKEYKLTAAPNTYGTAGYDLWGDYAVNGLAQASKLSNSSSKVGYVNGEDSVGTTVTGNITSSTVVFMAYDKVGTNYKYKAITGDQLKKIGIGDIEMTFANAYSLGTKQSKSSNSYDLDLVYLSTGANGVNDADTFFGYITSAVTVENANGDNVQQVKLVTKEGEQTLLTADNTLGLAMRQAIEYKLNSDGEISDILMQTAVDKSAVKAATATANGWATAAITKWASTVEFEDLWAGRTYSSGTTVTKTAAGLTKDYFETDSSDTVYLYISNEDHAGADSTTIETADDTGVTGAPAGCLAPNAFLVWDNEGTLQLVIYDVGNDINR